MAHFFIDAGPYAYLVLLVGLVGLVLALAHLVLATRRTRRDVEGLVVAGIGLTLAAGLLALGVNLIQTFEALAAAAPDQKEALGLMGTAISLYPLLLALGLAAAQVVLTMLARTLRATRAVRA